MDVFEVTECRQDGCVVITCAGEVDLATAGTLTDALMRVQRPPPERIVLDLTAVTFMGSSGLAVLVAAHNQFGRDRLRIVAPTDTILRLLHLTRLDEVLVVLPQLDAALL